jgi:hypothetical protein
MTGRRRQPRFLLAAPIDGALDVREQVAIERWEEREIEIISTMPSRENERLSLELAGDGDGQLTATVVECRPVVGPDGSIQYRVRMVFDVESTTSPDEGQRRS